MDSFKHRLSKRDVFECNISSEMYSRFILPHYNLHQPIDVPLFYAAHQSTEIMAVDETTNRVYHFTIKMSQNSNSSSSVDTIERTIGGEWRQFTFFRRIQENDVVLFSFATNPFRMVVQMAEDRKRKNVEYGAHAQSKRAKNNQSNPIAEQGLRQQQRNSGNDLAARYWLARSHLHSGPFCYVSDNDDSVKEISKGPRSSKHVNTHCVFGSAKLDCKEQGIMVNTERISTNPDGEHHTSYDLLESYKYARFFVIKAYGEDNVYNSIINKVWTSTFNGNIKLNIAYEEAKGKPDCPVFLLFSVNGSGQFVGLAEMVGVVDFNRTMVFWQQDKWTGCFPIKWHIIKDIPNRVLNHILLDNNDYRPVTRSRDTQEVKFEQGVELVRIFKSYLADTCILDDFGFYEARQKALQAKKSKGTQCYKQVRNDNITGAASIALPNNHSKNYQGYDVLHLPKSSEDQNATAAEVGSG